MPVGNKKTCYAYFYYRNYSVLLVIVFLTEYQVIHLIEYSFLVGIRCKCFLEKDDSAYFNDGPGNFFTQLNHKSFHFLLHDFLVAEEEGKFCMKRSSGF